MVSLGPYGLGAFSGYVRGWAWFDPIEWALFNGGHLPRSSRIAASQPWQPGDLPDLAVDRHARLRQVGVGVRRSRAGTVDGRAVWRASLARWLTAH
jgi:hypothetical protein